MVNKELEDVNKKFVDFNMKVYKELPTAKLWAALSYRRGFDNIDTQQLNYISPIIGVNFEKYIETTALDHYDAWQMRFNPAEPTRWQLALLDGAQVKRLRANTLENLSFFAGLERQGVLIRVIGKVEVEGLACVSLLFSHSNNISFLRYFDQRTGRLVKTETESGGEIREVGEIIVQGVRFPRKALNGSQFFAHR